jgi:hypothetical protein
MKLIFYTGHTLQGSYKGAFLYSREPNLTPEMMVSARAIISNAGLNPNDFCVVRNQCFLTKDEGAQKVQSYPRKNGTPFWFIGQKFFQGTTAVATELAGM